MTRCPRDHDAMPDRRLSITVEVGYGDPIEVLAVGVLDALANRLAVEGLEATRLAIVISDATRW